MNLLTLYLISIVPSVSNILEVFGVITMIGAVILFVTGVIAKCSDEDETANMLFKGLRKYTWIPVCFLFLSAVIPGKDQLYFMAGGYVATNTEGVAELPDNLLKAANSWLETIAEKEKEDK